MPDPPGRGDLEDRWRSLSPPGGAILDGAPVPGREGSVYLAVDAAGARHLLVAATPDADPGPARPSRGLHVQLRELSVAESPVHPWLDLVCTQASGHEAFTALAQDVLTALPSGVAGADDAVRAVLARWRWFWTADASHLVNGGALGLLGELWFLLRWLAPVTAPVLQRWQGPLRGRHDFVSAPTSVEVKATAGRPPGGPVHRIASLEQLEDPENGQLYLFSLQLTPDELATTSLTGLVDELLTRTAGDTAAADLAAERLAAAGWTPAHADQHRRPHRVLAEEFYQVLTGFPRLTRHSFTGGVPEGVAAVSYSLALAACRSWRLGTAPTDSAVVDALAGLRGAPPA